MRATSPVLPRSPQFPEVVIAKDQPPYLPLPVVKLTYSCGTPTALMRFKLTPLERLKVLLTGDFWIEQFYPATPFLPIRPTIHEPLSDKDAKQ